MKRTLGILISISLAGCATSPQTHFSARSLPHGLAAVATKMKQSLTTIVLSCVLLTTHADIYGQDGRAFYFSGRYLYDSQTGREVGYLSGDYLYSSSTGEEIGYLSNGCLYSAKTGQLLGYCDGD